MRPAAAYLRRSTDRQDQSVGDQRRAIEGFAAANELQVVQWFTDDAVSGAVAERRPAFQNLVATAQNGREWDTVLTYDVKRFGRGDNDEAGHYRYLLRRAGVDLIYVAESFNGDDTDDLLRPVKQWQARQESKDLSRVTLRGQVSLSEAGYWCGGTPPYGYDLVYLDTTGQPYQVVRFLEDGSKEIRDPQTGRLRRRLTKGEKLSRSKSERVRLVPSSPERVRIVRRIFDGYVAGLGYKSIAIGLNEEGLVSPRAASGWSLSTVRAIISNPLYVGDSVWNRRTRGKFHRVRGKSAEAKSGYPQGIERNAESDWVVVPDTHPAIISRRTWEKARGIRTLRREKTSGHGFTRGRAKNSEHILSSLTRCTNCGHRYHGTYRWRGKAGEKCRVRYYICGGNSQKGGTVCKPTLFEAEPLEAEVWATVEARVREFLGRGGKKRLRDLLKAELQGDGDPKAELVDAEARLAQLDEQADRLLESISPANADFLNRKLSRIGEERVRLEAKVAELRGRAAATDLDATVTAILAQLDDFNRVVSFGTPEEKKVFLRGWVEEVRLDPRSRASSVSPGGLFLS